MVTVINGGVNGRPGGGQAEQDKDDHSHARVQHLTQTNNDQVQLGGLRNRPESMGRSPAVRYRGI